LFHYKCQQYTITTLGLEEIKEVEESKGLLVPPDRLVVMDVMDRKDLKEETEHRVLSGLLDQLVHPVAMVQRVIPVVMDQRVTLDAMVRLDP
jgi:hypothetical protein